MNGRAWTHGLEWMDEHGRAWTLNGMDGMDGMDLNQRMNLESCNDEDEQMNDNDKMIIDNR